jgi:hypothetical protein
MTTRIDLQPIFTTSNTTTNNDPRLDNSSLETTQLQVLQTIQNLNSSVGGILVGDTVVDSSDSVTHDKLDTLNTTLTNKVLNKTTSSIDISGQTVAISNTAFQCSNLSQVPLITGFSTESTLGTTNSKLDTLNTTLTNKVLSKTTSSIDISGQTVAISNTSFDCSNLSQVPLITGFSTETTLGTTNDKLDTLNTTLTNKHLDKTTDSVDITNQNINVNQSVEGSSYDLLAQGSTLWADSLPAPNPFVADLLGREGWWYTNQANVANKSNIYWYANPPTGVAGGLQENDMTFSQLSGFYSVLTCDYVDNGSLTIPIFAVYSQATGVNDIIPTFAHSRWAYALTNVDVAKFRKGETVLLYSGATRPDVFNQLPAYQLQLAMTNGEALPTEIIAYMSVNTQATTSIIAYLLQYVGYLNSAVGHIKQYGFKNSKQRLAQENLASLTVTDGVLSVSGGGGGGTTSVVQGISTTSGVAVDINASPSGVGINRLLVNSLVSDGTNELSINNDGSLSTLSQVIAIDADNAESTIQIFGKANRLYTTAEITQGGNTLIVNEDGSINVAGGGGSGGNVTVDNIADTPLITGFATQTTLSALNNKVINDATYIDAVKTVVKGDVIVNPIIKKVDYDIVLNASLYGTSSGDTQPAFIPDATGLTGWSYLNTNSTKSSSVKFYQNIANQSNTVQSGINYFPGNGAGMAYFYAVISLDFIGNRSNTKNLPYLTLATQATGVDDYIPGEVNTIFRYSIPSGNDLVLGERILVYWSENSGDKPPPTVFPNLRRFKLQYAGYVGGYGGNKIAFMSIDTGLDVVEKQKYRLEGAGYKFLDVINDIPGENPNYTQCDFTFSTKTSINTNCYGSSDGTTFHHLKTTAQGNLITESKTHDGSNNPITSTIVDTKRGLDVNVISGGGGGGGGGVVQLQAYSSADGTTPVNVYATNNRLLTTALNGNPIVGAVGNIHTGNLLGSTFSTALFIDNQYGNDSVISYVDTSSAQTGLISIYGSFDNTTYFYIGVLQPVNVRSTLRNASSVLKLRGLKYIKIYNENAGVTSGLSVTLFSG